jgi:hypothetical protein
MKKLLLFLLPLVAFGQASRFDGYVFTTTGTTPPGAYAPVLAIPGATIKVYTNAGASTLATTYTDGTEGTTCPTSAQVVLSGTSSCVSTSDAQGNFGFWIAAGNYWYTETLPNLTVFGPFPITPGGSGGGGGGCPGGGNGQIQFNNAGACAGDPDLVWTPGSGGTAHITIGNGGFLAGDVATNNGFYAAFGASQGGLQAGGALFAGTSSNLGGYADFIPITYANYPAPLALYTFGANDLLIWASGTNATVTPNQTYGLNTNGYYDAAAGFASSFTAYQTFQAPNGGMTAKSFTGTVYLQSGSYSGAAPAATGTDTFAPGALSWSLTNNCETVFTNASTWVCLTSAAGTTPGGSPTDVQFNNSSAFGGSGNFVWANSAQELTVTGKTGQAGIYSKTGYVLSDGGFSTTDTNFNAIQAVSGGATGLNFTATNYIQTGLFSASLATGPTVTSLDTFVAGAMSWSTVATCEAVFNGSAWSCLGGGGTPGSPTTSVQYNNGGVFAGSANFIWANSAQELTVQGTAVTTVAIYSKTGYVLSDGGFSTTDTNYNSIQTTAGGLTGLSMTATNYVQLGLYSGSVTAGPTLTSLDTFHAGAASYNTTSGCLAIYSGTAWACIAGSGGTPGGSPTDVQFNNSGAFGGSANFIWANSAQELTVIGTALSSAAIYSQTGYVLSDGGFDANPSTATSYLAVQATGGGMGAKSFTGTAYVQTGTYSGAAPTLTTSDIFHAGTLSWSLTNSCETVFNGSAWSCLGGISAINTETGPAISLFGTANEITISTTTNTLTFATPQPIATSSNVTFGTVNSAGVVQSNTAAGTSAAFDVANGLGNPFIVNGNGDVNIRGAFISTASDGLGAFRVNTTVVIDASANVVGTTLVSLGDIQSDVAAGSGNAFTIANGLGNPLIINGNGDVNINGAFTSNASSSITGNVAFRVGGTTVIDGSRNISGVNGTFSGALGVTGNVTITASSSLAFTSGTTLIGSTGIVTGTILASTIAASTSVTSPLFIITTATAAAPSTSTIVLPTSVYGGGTVVLTSPTAWCTITQNGTAYKIPCY